MEDQLSTFLDFLTIERKYSENTTAAYRNDLNQFVSWLKNEYPHFSSWTEVDFAVVSGYSRSLKQQAYTASSVARKVAAIKSFFHYLLARGYVSGDPTATLESPKVKKRLPKTLSQDEIETLLKTPAKKDSPKNLRDLALLNLLYATGMRVTEAVTMRVEDVNLEEATVLCGSDADQGRLIPIDSKTQQILKTYLQEGRPHLVKDRQESALFLNHRGQQLTRQGLWLIIKAYANEAGLGAKVTPHTLRHSFAAHQLDEGTELREVQQLLGHANISTTQIYSHLQDEK